MKMVYAIIIILAALFSTPLQQAPPAFASSHQQKSFSGGLGGFPNFVGEYFGKAQLNSLINFINSASVLYRDDFQQNLMYIHNSMMAAYGNQQYLFGLVIQANSTTTYSRSEVVERYSASFAAGINLINPSWSYLAFFLYVVDDPLTMQYIQPLGKGVGISSAREAYINQTIRSNESGPCTCAQIYLWLLLQKFDNLHFWLGSCHSGPVTHAYVPVCDQQWMAAKPASCYYLMFAY